MSKIPDEILRKAITDMLTEKKKRGFEETVEMQVGLRDYDPDKRFKGSVKLTHKVRGNVKVHYHQCRFV